MFSYGKFVFSGNLYVSLVCGSHIKLNRKEKFVRTVELRFTNVIPEKYYRVCPKIGSVLLFGN